MRQFFIGILTAVGVILIAGYFLGYFSRKSPSVATRQESKGREVVNDMNRNLRINNSEAAPVTQVTMSPIEREALKQEIMNSIRTQMDICRPAPVCEEKKVVATPPVKKRIVRRKTSVAKTIAPVAKPICSESAAYRSCLNDRYARWDERCTTKTIETVEAKPWKNDNRRMTRLESQSTIIEIDAENICDSPRTEIERYCLQKICLEVK